MTAMFKETDTFSNLRDILIGGFEHYIYNPGDKARLIHAVTWVGPNGSYTIPAGEIVVIKDESPEIVSYYRFSHVDVESDALVAANDMNPVPPDTPHKCFCPKDTVIHFGCKCKGI